MASKLTHVSSSLTLLIKYALPTVWLVFFGAMTGALWFTKNINAVTEIPATTFRLVVTGAYLFGAFLIYWFMMRIKRVEMDEHFFYVTDYFKNVRYPYHQIEKVVEKDFLIFKTIHIHLKEAATFGKKITFISSRDRFNIFLKEHPEVVGHLGKATI